MAKIEKKTNSFESYKIVIETEEEHMFLEGLLAGSPVKKKECCREYNVKMDQMFWDLIRNSQNEK